MSLLQLTEADAVRQAMAEFRRSGADLFLKKYGFGPAREYFVTDGKLDYDSKAIVGAAFGYQFPKRGPLAPHDFSGGENTVEPLLTGLGFRVRRTAKPRRPDASRTDLYLSDRLVEGAVYARKQLRRMFGITAASLNNGVFAVPDTASILLFPTEKKTKDRVQFVDRLEGDTLRWQGQPKGGSDLMLIEHEARGLEILLFYRTRKYQYGGAAFRYEGRFVYTRHRLGPPTNFVFSRTASTAQADAAAPLAEDVDPSSLKAEREKVLRSIAARRGQQGFRRRALAAYEGRCAVTDCDAEAVLEAAHVHPYVDERTNAVTNALLLRSDIHTLFDLFLIAVDPKTYKIEVSPQLAGTIYADLAGRKLRLPAARTSRPGNKVLTWHRAQCLF